MTTQMATLRQDCVTAIEMAIDNRLERIIRLCGETSYDHVHVHVAIYVTNDCIAQLQRALQLVLDGDVELIRAIRDCDRACPIAIALACYAHCK